MVLNKRKIDLFLIFISAISISTNIAYSKDFTRNVTVKMNKPQIIWNHWIVNTRFDKGTVKCIVSKPPDMRMWKKLKFGKVKIKKGVVYDNNKLSGDIKKY